MNGACPMRPDHFAFCFFLCVLSLSRDKVYYTHCVCFSWLVFLAILLALAVD